MIIKDGKGRWVAVIPAIFKPESRGCEVIEIDDFSLSKKKHPLYNRLADTLKLLVEIKGMINETNPSNSPDIIDRI